MVNERFIELLTKKLSHEIDADEIIEFKHHLSNDSDCRQHYNFFKTYWVVNSEQYSNTDFMFQQIKNKIAVFENSAETNTEDETSPIKKFIRWRSIAAVLAAGLCLSVFYYISKSNSKTEQAVNLEQLSTPSRIKSKITLSDGSVVMLNSESTLKYPLSFKGNTREVYLNGEAFFEVQKDHRHPFIVHSGKMSIKVLGTAFNVKSYANEASSETTLIRGAIEVTLADRPSDRIILKPFEKLILANNTVPQSLPNKLHLTVNPADSVKTKYTLTNLTFFKANDTTIVETSWVNNRLVFKDEDFFALSNQMERWYGIKFKFKNDKIKDYPFTGIFDKEDINQALHALELIEPFEYKIKNKTVYIY